MAAESPGLVRAIGRWDFTAAIINGVIGSGIFSLPSVLAGLTGAWSPLTFVLAGLGMLTMLLCMAEVASRFTEAGGPYLYVREAFGRDAGFQAGWLTFFIRATSAAAALNVFTDYLGPLAPVLAQGTGRVATMTVVLGVITAINVLGVRQATWAVDALTAGKLLPLALLIVLGLPRVSEAVLATQTVAHADWTQAVLLLVFAYGGFDTPLIVAGEVRRPRKDSAFALIVGMAVIAFVYTLVQVVAVGVVPALAATKAPLAEACRRLMGGPGVLLITVGAMVSTYGLATGSVLAAPRLLFSMARRGELPAVLGRVHPRFRTPDVAILAYAAVTLGFALYGSFTWNATVSAIVRLVTYGLICAALLVFRRRGGEEPGFRLPGGAVIAPVAIAFALWLLSTRTFRQAWVLAVLIAVGWGLGRLARRSRAAPPLTTSGP
ncbi:MAG: amino acid transporter [Acidobacteria bacterium]|nr:MAG: amino acid transporter [Acidobacteriota bacterium]